MGLLYPAAGAGGGVQGTGIALTSEAELAVSVAWLIEVAAEIT
jgi:hypothetical protein